MARWQPQTQLMVNYSIVQLLDGPRETRLIPFAIIGPLHNLALLARFTKPYIKNRQL